MEALAALGLAGNILQFVDFSQKLVSRTLEIHRSGSLNVHTELELFANDLSGLCTSLADSKAKLEPQWMPKKDRDILPLAESCETLASEFSLVLQNLKSKSRIRKWATFQQALKSVWNDGAIKEYTERLEKYRNQVLVHFLNFLCIQGNLVLATLNELSTTHRRLEIRNSTELHSLKNEILNLFGNQVNKYRARMNKAALGDDVISKVDVGSEITYTKAPEDIFLAQFLQEPPRKLKPDDKPISIQLSSEYSDKLTHLVELLLAKAGRVSHEIAIIQSLTFQELDSRRSQIAEASNRTFEWMFNEDSGFVKWLKSPHGKYWITGKPGSGKSTLMKFTCDHDLVGHNLQPWAQGKRVLVANFFFWHSGTPMQKSQQGLLQTLLCSILRQCPSLMPELIPGRFGQPPLMQPPWTCTELAGVFQRLREHPAHGTRFCFFIDGLDEYTGDHREIIRIIDDMAESGIKVCFSSRAWNVFEEAYSDNAGFKLYVQDHTSDDIANFVDEQFRRDKRFLRLRNADPEYEHLVNEILWRANGVFLWVFLVVRSFSRGLTNSDTIADFQRRLKAIPTDLKTYFKVMLESTEDVYQIEAGRIYRMCLKSPRPIPLTPLSFFAEDDYSQFGVQALPGGVHNTLQIHENTEIAIRRIRARCPDLLEITQFEQSTDHSEEHVQFIHRTAHDFIASEDILRYLTSLEPAFNADEHLCHAYILYVKILRAFDRLSFKSYIRENDLKRYALIADIFLYHANSLKRENHSQSSLLYSMALAMSFGGSAYSPLMSDFEEYGILISLAIQQGKGHLSLLKRLKNKIQKLIQQGDNEYSLTTLLILALLPQENLTGRIVSDYREEVADIDIASFLLEAGTIPTMESEVSSALKIFVNACLKHRRDTKTKPITAAKSVESSRVIDLLISRGANLTANFTYGDVEIDLPTAIFEICLGEDAARLNDLIKQKALHGEPSRGEPGLQSPKMELTTAPDNPSPRGETFPSQECVVSPPQDQNAPPQTGTAISQNKTASPQSKDISSQNSDNSSSDNNLAPRHLPAEVRGLWSKIFKRHRSPRDTFN